MQIHLKKQKGWSRMDQDKRQVKRKHVTLWNRNPHGIKSCRQHQSYRACCMWNASIIMSKLCCQGKRTKNKCIVTKHKGLQLEVLIYVSSFVYPAWKVVNVSISLLMGRTTPNHVKSCYLLVFLNVFSKFII